MVVGGDSGFAWRYSHEYKHTGFWMVMLMHQAEDRFRGEAALGDGRFAQVYQACRTHRAGFL